MPITKRGVYHNLKESKYVVSNKEITLFFSSEYTLNKFMNGYTDHRNYFSKRIANLTGTPLNFDTLADVDFYKKSEKRGFYVKIKGVSITDEQMNQYAQRKMSDKESPEWFVIGKLRFLNGVYVDG